MHLFNDFDEFRKLSFFEQWDEAVAFAVMVGNRPNLAPLLFHLIFFLIEFFVFVWVTRATISENAENWHGLVFKNTVVYNLMLNYLGLSLQYNGPIYGEVGWRLVARRFFTGIPIKRGWLGRMLPSTRRWYDVLHTVALTAVCLQLFVAGEAVHPQMVILLACLALSGFLVFDLGAWIGSQGMQFHWPLLWLVQHFVVPSFNVLPVMQLWCLGVYIGCGLSKIGPWWALGFANEWTTPPPLAGQPLLAKLFLRDPTGRDYRSTNLASLVSHASAIVEFGAPVLILSGIPALKNAGFLLLAAMHLYIVGHLAHADVYGLNWMTLHTLYLCHIEHSLDVASVGPLVSVVLALEFGYAIFGQGGNTHRTIQSLCYKFWSGNYSHAFYVFSPAGKSKLNRRIANPSSPLHKLGPCGTDNAGPAGLKLMDESKLQASMVRALGMMWYAQLVLRILPKLLADYFKERNGNEEPSLTESFGSIYHNMNVNQWLMGVVSHEVAWTDVALQFLQAECDFEEGELTVVVLYAFGSFSHLLEKRAGCGVDPFSRGGKGLWLIRDAKKGIVRQGTQSSIAVAEHISRPSDCTKLGAASNLKKQR